MSINNNIYKRYTITAALPYANGPLHIGHLAGVYIPADVYVRYLRSKNEDVVFVCGSDEHGVPITIKARMEGLSPQQIVDKYHNLIKDSFEKFGISFDIYSRTSSTVHHKMAADFFKKLYEKGVFIEATTKQYYDEVHKQFLADRYITGTCPHCGNTKAYGDQCEQCGTSLNAIDLINPRSVISGNIPILKETKHWFLPLNKYEDKLKKWILEEHKDDWKVNVYGQCKSWLDNGLQPRAVTRDLDWGVKVPLEGAEGKVLYVWFDAPIGYISATKEWAEKNNKNWEPYWKDKDTCLIHFIGKDNIVFHCIIFPVMLMEEGTYILPCNVPAFEFLNLENDKISTSRNWAVWLHDYLRDFPDKQDVLRYVLLSIAPETKDNDFTWKDYQARNNSELVAILGNFVNRTLVLIQKFFNGEVPPVTELLEEDNAILKEIQNTPSKIAMALDNFHFREALTEMMNLARAGNKYLTDNEPWKLFVNDPKRTQTILNICIQICANLTIIAEPFLPFTASKLSNILNIKQLKWADAGRIDLISQGHLLQKPSLLFEKIEDDIIDLQIKRLLNIKQHNYNNVKNDKLLKPQITYEDFAKLDLRNGVVLEAEKVPKTKKLLKLLIDTGIDKRVVISGIAEYYTPEQIIGKRVIVLINLEPREVRGIVSKGMILMAENKEGELIFVAPEKDIEPGSEIK